MIITDTPSPITLESLKSAVGNTWFNLDEQSSTFEYETRDNGDVGEEEAGEADVEEARRIVKAIRSVFPRDIYEVSDDICDEWVTVSVRKTPYSAEEIAKKAQEAKAWSVYSMVRDAVKALPKSESSSIRPAIKLEGHPINSYNRMTLIADFGERFANLNHLGAQVVFKTEEEAEKALRDFTHALPEMSISGWEMEIAPSRKRTSHSGAPIENIGKVKFTVKF